MNIAITFAAVAVALVGIPLLVGRTIRVGMDDHNTEPADLDELDDAKWEHALLYESRTLEPHELPSRNQP